MKFDRWRAFEWALIIGMALLAIGPALRPNHVVGDGVDMYGTIWFYWWIQHCMQTMSDPGFTDYFFYPLGKDIFAHTGNNFLDAVVAAPFYWIIGSPAYQRWFVFFVLILNAATFRVFARSQLSSKLGVLVATLAWMLNPYVLFEITCGRLTQAFVPFVPLAFYHLLKMEGVQRGWARWRHPLLAGLMVGLQGWTYWFMGYFMALVMLPVFLWAIWNSQERERLLLNYLVAGLACMLVVAPAGLAMSGLAAEGAVPGLSDGVSKSLFELPAGLANNVAANLHGWVFAEFMGTPLLISFAWTPLILAWLVLGRERLRWVPAFFLVWLFALGPSLHPPVPNPPIIAVLPWYMAAYHYLPFFDRLWFPYRAIIMCFFVLSLGAGQVIQALEERKLARGRWLPAVALVFFVVSLGEQWRMRVFPFTTRDLTMPATYEMIRDNPGYVIHLPFGISQPSIIWQTFHEQKMFGGMGENAALLLPDEFSRRRQKNSFVRALIDGTRRPSNQMVKPLAVHRQAFQDEGFRWVVLHRDLIETQAAMDHLVKPPWRASHQATKNLIELLGPPVAVDGVLVTWDLSGELGPLPGYQPDDTLLTAHDWVTHEIPAYELALQATGRIPPRPGSEPD